MSSSDRADSRRDKYEGMTRAQILEAKRAERNAANWRGVKVERSKGVAEATLAIERQALLYCRDGLLDGMKVHPGGHALRANGTQGCRFDLHEALMGRLGQQQTELPPLPASVRDREARHLDELLSTGARWKLSGLLAAVNERRAAEHKDPYTETACSARIRDLRKVGRVIHQEGDAGGAEYWMDVPGVPAPLGG